MKKIVKHLDFALNSLRKFKEEITRGFTIEATCIDLYAINGLTSGYPLTSGEPSSPH